MVGGRLIRTPIRPKPCLVLVPKMTAAQRRMSAEDRAGEVVIANQIMAAALALAKGTLEAVVVCSKCWEPATEGEYCKAHAARSGARDGAPAYANGLLCAITIFYQISFLHHFC